MDLDAIQFKRNLITTVRTFFTDRGFFEMETPLLVKSPAMESTLHGFETTYIDHSNREHSYYLPTSPEFALKKALAQFQKPIFEICRVFRNRGELGPLHHPEFNMLEWYEPGDYSKSVETVTALIEYLTSSLPEQYLKSDLEWSGPFREWTIQELFHKYASMDLVRGIADQTYWLNAGCRVLGQKLDPDETFEDIFFRVWLDCIEPNLGRTGPVIVKDYPPSMAALARLKPDDESWAERWELYINGIEIGNAFGELTDSEELRERWKAAGIQRQQNGFSGHPVDADVVEAVGRMHETTGVAIGIERLGMALSGIQDIRRFFINPLDNGAG